MLIFVIPLMSSTVAKSWERVVQLLERCLQSVCNQTSETFHVVVACHELPPVPLNHSHLHYLQVDLPIPDPNNLAAKRYDMAMKRAIAIDYAEQFKPTHVMHVDADDCVSRHLAEFVSRHPGHNGWFFNQGYEYHENSSFLYLRTSSFHLRCGTSNIVKYSIYPRGIDADLAQTHHKKIRNYLANQQHSMTELPFNGAVYVIKHGENVYSNGSIDAAESGLMYQTKRWLYRLPRTRLITPSIRKDYSLYPLST